MSVSGELQARINAVKLRADLAGLIGRTVKLRKAGRERVGLCPFHSESTPSFTVAPEKGFYHCFGCGAHGDAIQFVMALRGCDFMAALAELEHGTIAGPALAPAASSRPAPRSGAMLSSTEAGQAVWADSRPCSVRDLPARYLRSRGIDPVASGVLDTLRFHPSCPVSPWRKGEAIGAARGLRAPAMLAPAGRVEGGPGDRRWVMTAVHITFLDINGTGKAKLPPWIDRDGIEHPNASRKMWGEPGRAAVPIRGRENLGRGRVQPRWIDRPEPLIVAEGIESTLSLLDRHPGARGAFATLSLQNLQGGWINDGPKQSLRLWQVSPDPEKRPFTVSHAGDVIIGIDADMKGLKDRPVQERPRGPVVRRDLTGAERSTICAQLAAAHWRAAGARSVRVVRPPMGRDFNDMAMEAVA